MRGIQVYPRISSFTLSAIALIASAAFESGNASTKGFNMPMLSGIALS